MTITAKYPGKCYVCGQRIDPGEEIDWDKATRRTRHAVCPEAKAVEPAATLKQTDVIKISGGSGYGWRPMKAGQVVRNTKRNIEAGGPEWLYVLEAWRQYYGEDGMSFGVGHEQGYVYGADCRPATPEEAAPKIAEIQAAEARKVAKARVAEITKTIRDTGERPEPKPIGPNTKGYREDYCPGYFLRGEKVLNTQDIYGGGEWFVIEANHIWYVRNNGMDGDNWGCNNVATGGAGAIGWRIPMDEALAEELRRLNAVLGEQNC